MIQIKCPNKLFGAMEDDVLEVKCRSRFCGAEPGVVVLHRFKMPAGDLIETVRFRDPGKGTP